MGLRLPGYPISSHLDERYPSGSSTKAEALDCTRAEWKDSGVGSQIRSSSPTKTSPEPAIADRRPCSLSSGADLMSIRRDISTTSSPSCTMCIQVEDSFP